MDLFAGVRRYLQTLATPKLPLYADLQDTARDIGRPAVYPTPNIAVYITAYNTNATVYTILTYLIQKFGNIPRYMYNIEDEQAEKSLKWMLRQRQIKLREIKQLKTKAYSDKPVQADLSPEGRLAALTSRPNDDQGQDSYYAEVYLFYELTGEAFVFLNRGIEQGTIYDDSGQIIPDEVISKMRVLEKIVLPSQFVTVVPAKEDINTVLYYRFEKTPGIYINYRKVDIIHWKKSNPNYDGSMGTHLRGMAPLSAGLKLLTQDNSSTDAAVSMQQNQGAKGLLFNKTIANPTPDQVSQIRDVVDTKVNNTGVKGSVAFLGGADYDYKNFGLSAVDLQLLESKQKIFINFCNLYGVPPAIFLTETTYENLQQAGKSLLTNKILPACCSFRDEENRVLLPAFGLDPSKYTTDIDASVITELSEDMTALSTQLANSPWKTPNEKREAMGDEKSDNPNMDLFLFPNNVISLDDLIVSDGLDSFTADSGNSLSNNPGGAKP